MHRRAFLLSSAASAALAKPLLRLATFDADVTPPVGAPIYTGTAHSIVDPLEARGVVLLGAGRPLVIVSVDWCEIRNRSYDMWRDKLAAAAGTTRERVLVSCVHQHDAPYTDTEAQQLLDEVKSADRLHDPEFEERTVSRLAAALRGSLGNAVPVTEIGAGEARVEQVASNRRYVLPDGKVSFSRTSATRDKTIRDMPVGLIDPMLKCISFWNGGRAIAALHCYSTHPMSYYGQGNVSADFVGMARRKMQAQSKDTFHIYFSGASGDTMAGRYNDGNPQNRPVLADRVFQGMSQAFTSTRRSALSRASFRNAKLLFAPRRTKGFSDAELRALLDDAKTPRRARLDAALGISWYRRLARRQPIDVPAIDLGVASIVVVPAEAFVQYQLWAQQARPDRMVMTLGYGECAPGYIPTSAAVAEGYDDHYSWVDFSQCERALRGAITAALG
jgi:hypothetical protein